MKHFFVFISLFVVLGMRSQNMDMRVVRTLNAKEMPTWDKGMLGVTNSVYVAMPLSVGAIWLDGHTHNDPVMKRNAFKGGISIGLAIATTTGIKYLVNRKRPFAQYPGEIIQRDKLVGPYSFPSGHTTSAFATATALSLSYQKWQVAVPAYLYAGFVGYSRMRLGVHYPSDVLAGILIGVGSGFLTWQLDKRINGK